MTLCHNPNIPVINAFGIDCGYVSSGKVRTLGSREYCGSEDRIRQITYYTFVKVLILI